MHVARKSVKQRFAPPPSLAHLMESFRLMCNDAIRIGLTSDTSSLKRLSMLTYPRLVGYDVPSCYKLCAISKAAGFLAARKKSIKRGYPTKNPYVSRSLLSSCYSFKIEGSSLLIPLGSRHSERISLTPHTTSILSKPEVRVRSFTLTPKSLSVCIAKDVEDNPVEGIVGVDRNLRNVAAGSPREVIYYDVSKVVDIAETTKNIMRSYGRSDARMRKKISEKYGRRRQERVRQILNRVSKSIVVDAKANREAIAFENMVGIRKLYRKGNGQGRKFRARMNAWPFAELKRQVEYKAAWEGVPVVTLSVNETRGTTMDCYRCGERLQGSRDKPRQLWCQKCERWEDRDLVAVMNISRRGWVRFAQSKGEAGEAVKGNETKTLILRVDASKPSLSKT